MRAFPISDPKFIQINWPFDENLSQAAQYETINLTGNKIRWIIETAIKKGNFRKRPSNLNFTGCDGCCLGKNTLKSVCFDMTIKS